MRTTLSLARMKFDPEKLRRAVLERYDSIAHCERQTSLAVSRLVAGDGTVTKPMFRRIQKIFPDIQGTLVILRTQR